MKTTNNAQKTENGLVKKVILRGSAVIISLVLISWSVGAQNFWDQVLTGYNYGKMAMTRIENSYQTNGSGENDIQFELETQANNLTETTFEAIEAELELQVEAYNAADFVEAELAAETKNFMKSDSETIEVELTLQVEAYNAADFVEAELAAETESWMNSNVENTFGAIEAELALQVEVYDPAKFVEAEIALEIESWMTKKEIIKSAEVFTANGAVREIEKYAQKQIELQTKTQE
ncbi:MAG: hypothetical protein Q8S54_16965 [Bacteroidota bacterium]|nr:hypothetical protein [Bacteroidota bacterium]